MTIISPLQPSVVNNRGEGILDSDEFVAIEQQCCSKTMWKKLLLFLLYSSWLSLLITGLIIFISFSTILNTHINCYYMILDVNEKYEIKIQNLLTFFCFGITMLFFYAIPVYFTSVFITIYLDYVKLLKHFSRNILINQSFFCHIFDVLNTDSYHKIQINIQTIVQLINMFYLTFIFTVLLVICLLIVLSGQTYIAYNIMEACFGFVVVLQLVEVVSYLDVKAIQSNPFMLMPFYIHTAFWFQLCSKGNIDCKILNKNKSRFVACLSITSILCFLTLLIYIFLFIIRPQIGGVAVLYLVLYWFMMLYKKQKVDKNSIWKNNQVQFCFMLLVGMVSAVIFLLSLIFFLQTAQSTKIQLKIEKDQQIQRQTVYRNIKQSSKNQNSGYCVNDGFGFNLLDYSILTSVAYGTLPADEYWKQQFSVFKYKDDYNFIFYNKFDEFITVFYPKQNTVGKTTVYGFRGTNSFIDAYHDLQIFIPFVCRKICKFFLVNLVDNFLTYFIEVTYDNLGTSTFKSPTMYYERVIRAFQQLTTKSVKEMNFTNYYSYDQHSQKVIETKIDPCYNSNSCSGSVPNYDLPVKFEVENSVLTGHSLGGGLAKKVALVANMNAVSVSGPGIHQIAIVSDNPEGIITFNTRFRNVVPARDLIPLIGIQEGIVVNLPCWSDSFLTCHKIENTICKFAFFCGETELTQMTQADGLACDQYLPKQK